MSTIITRLFHDRGRAASAVAALQRLGFPASTIHLIGGDGGSDDAAVARFAERLRAVQVAPAAATAYAKEAARTNGSLVVVYAPFSRAVPAVAELEACGATAIDVPDHYRRSVDNAAPLSEMLGLPVLSRNPAPLSSLFGLPVLTSGKSNTNLMNNPAPLSNAINLPLLKDGPGDKSFGLPLLKDGPGDKSFGLPLLKDGPGDTSFGLPLLSRNPTPLSSLFGLPVLSKRPGEKRD